mmetsp:Transcript_2931/g.8741  ORF Transcript_2931/g.8741 Transcript_2931/m.8741 type:complete len:91 (+) Transcript_2931:1402-1674(+)
MVLRRWATNTLVLCAARSSKLRMIAISVALSRALVASSAISILGFFRNARAIATRCFSPPDNLRPRSPTGVAHPSGIRSTASDSLAACTA